LHSVPQLLVDDRLLLAVIDLALMDNLPMVDGILEEIKETSPCERDATAVRAAGANLDLGDDATLRDLEPAVPNTATMYIAELF
jgi:hypothetical protein